MLSCFVGGGGGGGGGGTGERGDRAKTGDLNSDHFFCSNARPQGSRPGSKECKFPKPKTQKCILLGKKGQQK